MDYHGVETAHRVTIVGLHFMGDTALWFKWYKLHIGSGLWATFTESLLQRFGPANQLDFNMSFSHVLQKGSLEDYINDFICLSCRAEGWIDQQILGAFIGGLKMELQNDILAQGPHFLSQAIELACIYNNKHNRRRLFRPFSARSSFPHPSSSSSSPPPPQKPASPSPAQPLLRLSLVEVHQCHSHGQCLYCPEMYYLDHTFAMPHLLLLDVAAVSEAASETPIDDPMPVPDEFLLEYPTPITFNALVSLKRTCGRAMRLLGHITNLSIRVFIDSGANLNFLNPSIATRLSLCIDHSLIEPVTVVNGRLSYTKGLALNVIVNLHDYSFSSNIRLLSVMGGNLVLGTEWLETLG
ncbi:uncharacterized protein LOC103952495 [Pyrus x bretschneideri]|uniref:uncharacterized protein LOC103952495 n=1 Tax=Pyrus x bretschneideri TaxID=225117 RepID=UPI00202E3B50|nr:uncharacterized protein LOC103952495 [Pyrus x bretschneideri]XP_048446015.1 uncharacterized protein LOC103952495 [Pyrus x bretschneideri]XP_048446016.1 uncharacterized protein LOC103952495 [Pyrus x bretschneideri]XP_048446017.1 uncharacterized protein LOC103952495 [Pyrus x bretschneideri]